MPSPAPTHPSVNEMPSLTLNLRQAHTMSQGGIPVKHEDPAELQRWHELVAQVGRELAGPLTAAMERLNTWSTTGQVDRAGLRALKDEVDQARQAGIWCQQIARLASGRVQPSQERVHLTHTVQSALAYRNRELQARGISISQTLLPAEILVDASMLFSLINSMIDWWLSQSIGQVELKLDRTAWPERARLRCSFPHTPADQQDSASPPSSLSNLTWFVVEQTAKTMGLSVEHVFDSERASLSVEFPNTIAMDLPTLVEEAYLDHEAVNSKPLAGSHVLVIAHRRDLRIQVREALKNMGLVLDFVSNLKEASEFCREGFPHAIVFEAALHTAAFDKLTQDIRKEVPEFVFIELVHGSDHFDISSVSRTGMARVGAEVIPEALPSALIYELSRVM